MNISNNEENFNRILECRFTVLILNYLKYLDNIIKTLKFVTFSIMRKIVKAKCRKKKSLCSNCHKSGHYINKCKEPCSNCGNTGHTFH